MRRVGCSTRRRIFWLTLLGIVIAVAVFGAPFQGTSVGDGLIALLGVA
jgi:hypothetical protein